METAVRFSRCAPAVLHGKQRACKSLFICCKRALPHVISFLHVFVHVFVCMRACLCVCVCVGGCVCVQELDDPILVPHAQDAKALKDNKFPYERLFRSFQKSIVDTGVREYLFGVEFFGLKESKGRSCVRVRACVCARVCVRMWMDGCTTHARSSHHANVPLFLSFPPPFLPPSTGCNST